MIPGGDVATQPATEGTLCPHSCSWCFSPKTYLNLRGQSSQEGQHNRHTQRSKASRVMQEVLCQVMLLAKYDLHLFFPWEWKLGNVFPVQCGSV